MALTAQEEMEYIALLELEEHYQSGRKIWTYFPETGPLRRELYTKHLEFFRAGKQANERMFIAANRVGKTEGTGLYEMTLHMTGQYPEWWPGRRLTRPNNWWAAGTTGKTTRDILQKKLLGNWDDFGTALLPRDSIVRTSPKAGVPEAIEIVRVKHAPTDGISTLVFKSFDQGPDAFEGTEQDGILLDEEPPLNVYTPCLLRTMTVNGMVLLTFTPWRGMTETVLQFLPDGSLPQGPQTGNQYVVNAGWDDAPHLTDEMKDAMLSRIPAFQRDARSKGLPQLGAGLIYPVPESEYVVDDFELPPHWLRTYGLDVGWNWTAAIHAAYDREADIWYLYREYKRGEAEPSIHAEAVRAPGAWIHGVIDPAASGRSQTDGKRLIEMYRDRGLILTPYDNSVETGTYQVWERLSTGRLKVFRSLTQWQREQGLYRRDEKGRIVKENDHLMDATRGVVMSGRPVAKAVPVERDRRERAGMPVALGAQGWMG